MGTYAKVMVALEIVVKKKQDRYLPIETPTDEIVEKMGEMINLELYNIYESRNEVDFILKEDIFRKNIKAFVLEQVEIFNSDAKKVQVKDMDEMLTAIESEEVPLEKINEYRYQFNDIDLGIVDWGWPKYRYISGLITQWKGFYYLYEGKAILEDDRFLSTYLHKLIRMCSDNPLKDTVVIDFD